MSVAVHHAYIWLRATMTWTCIIVHVPPVTTGPTAKKANRIKETYLYNGPLWCRKDEGNMLLQQNISDYAISLARFHKACLLPPPPPPPPPPPWKITAHLRSFSGRLHVLLYWMIYQHWYIESAVITSLGKESTIWDVKKDKWKTTYNYVMTYTQ